jgi:hypothetical protein
MTEVDVRSTALFFFYAFLDEQKAIEAASQAVQVHKNKIYKNPETKPAIALVAATYEVWMKNSSFFVRGKHNYSPETGWQLPHGLDMGPWREFQKSAPEDEFLSLIWSQVLNISDEDIALGLGISVGTLRYRTGRALRRLGTLTNPVSTKETLGIARS